MDNIKEIARILRSTDKMAAAFVQSVRDKVGDDVPEEIILASMKKLNPRSIEIAKVVSTVKQELTRERKRQSRARANTRVISIAATSKAAAAKKHGTAKAQVVAPRAPANSASPSATMIEQLEEVLNSNWHRAEQEGFSPERFTGSSFIKAVHRHCDPRDATKARIIRACKSVDGQDVIVTPTAVADVIRKEN